MRLLFACFALGAFLMAATPASASQFCGGPCNQIPPGDGSGGGSCAPDDQCCICQAAAAGQAQSCRSTCDLIPIGAGRVACYNQCASNYDQDLLNCTINNYCA